MNPNSNYIRVDTLSWSSIEIYALLFVLLVFLRILVSDRDKNADSKLIKIYVLAVMFNDSAYRIASMQIAELIIILTVIFDVCRHKFRIAVNSLTVFMLMLFAVFLFSDIRAACAECIPIVHIIQR